MIYNKKGFISGIFFLFLAICNVIILFINPNKISILFLIICLLFSIPEILRSLNEKSSNKDKVIEDERKIYIYTRSGNSTAIITFLLCILIIIVLTLSGSKWISTNLIAPMITILCIISSSMLIIWICSYIYYNRKE
ncbi:hypothetical protein [Clostridium hydrogenum]|uniref:hypothetical protein n=1 Tax=Clostridium hydrogenum TaxID=2855764 RepID=UPI001F288A27|nr:hypothetical protein [Clostridium hydrogenum]